MPPRTRRILALAVAAILVVAVVAVVAMALARRTAPIAAAPSPLPAAATTMVATAHYRIESSADPAQTARTADAVEALHAAWSAFFADVAPVATIAPLRLRLYRDQAEFKANNRSSPWAEAYYLAPVCHAYYDADGSNPTHWMLHEAVHQLNREVGGFASAKWQNEGLATYFGASALRDGVLPPGTFATDAYPIRWLAGIPLSGDLAADIHDGRFNPLRALLAGSGPPIDENVNLYYLQWWSLTHFLLHHDGGKYAATYRQLLTGDGSLAEFERAYGDVEALQDQWYDYLRARIAEASAASR